LKCDGTRWRTVGGVKGKLANGVCSWYSSHYLGTLLPLMRTSRLPVVDWTDAPCRFKRTRSVSPKDEIWFLRVCHHISNAVYCIILPSTLITSMYKAYFTYRLIKSVRLIAHHEAPNYSAFSNYPLFSLSKVSTRYPQQPISATLQSKVVLQNATPIFTSMHSNRYNKTWFQASPREVDEHCALPSCYAASSGRSSLKTFRDNLSVLSASFDYFRLGRWVVPKRR
jgi:hypothetical protein